MTEDPDASASRYPSVGLPSREQIERAIQPWFSGGGTARRIVDVLRRGEANLGEARRLAERLAHRAEAMNFISEDNIAEALEMIRAAAAANVVAGGDENDVRNIGSLAWRRRAAAISKESWERFFPGEPLPRNNLGESYSDTADEQYRAMIRAQREHIATTVGEGRRKARREP